MNEKPIIFSTPMVQAILEGRKTQTRRVIKPQPVLDNTNMWQFMQSQWQDSGLGMPECAIEDYAQYKISDILWVRETFTPWSEDTQYFYRASLAMSAKAKDDAVELLGAKWKPSIHMPRAAARIFLRVTGVRAERVQDITPQDAKAEGMSIANHTMRGGYGGDDSPHYREEFAALWDALNAKRGYPWQANPWVWVYEFERVER